MQLEALMAPTAIPSKKLTGVIAHVAAALIGCGASDASHNASGLQADGEGGTTEGSGAPAAADADGTRVLFRTDEGYAPYLNVVSETMDMEYKRTYSVIALYKNGFAYVGSSADDIDSTACDRVTNDPAGHALCVSYEIANGSIRLGDKAKPFVDGAGEVTIDGQVWTVVGAARPAVGSYQLTGFYGFQAPSTSSLPGANLVLSADGTFTAERGEHSYTALPSAFWSGCSRTCTITGTYTVHSHSITMQPKGGKPKDLFLRVVPDMVQIGNDWFGPNRG